MVDYKKDFTSQFIKAMKEWDIPEGNKEKRENVENEIRDGLVERREVLSYKIQEWDDSLGKGVALLCHCPTSIRDFLIFIESDNQTKVAWGHSAMYLGRVDDCILRITNAQPIDLQSIFKREREKKLKQADLW